MKKINWFEPKINNFNYNILRSTLKNNFISEGRVTSFLEKKIAKFLKIKNVVMTSSGTSALYLALRSLNISPKDEVILPNITYVATLNAIKLTGAKPVLADVNKNTSLLDLSEVKKKISKKTKAIIFVHISGRSGNLKEILKFAKLKKIKIIEDAAEAFGSKYKNKRIGTLGDLGCFSFTPTKIITSGQGGAVVANNKRLIDQIRSLKDQGRTEKKVGGDDQHDLFGGNFKFNDILASVLIPQILKINNYLTKAEKINAYYRKKLREVKKIEFYEKAEGETCIWTEIKTDKRDKLFDFLLKKKIKCRKIWKPLSSFKVNRIRKKFNNSEIISKKLMWLPSSLSLSFSELNEICRLIKIFFKNKN